MQWNIPGVEVVEAWLTERPTQRCRAAGAGSCEALFSTSRHGST
jgi:hypothetical protein